MQYIPKELDGNVNISHVSPIREFFLLLGGLLGTAVVIYILLGFTVNKAVDWMPPEAETGLGEIFAEKFINDKRTDADEDLQDLLDNLLKDSPLQSRDYRVHTFDTPDINAVALPGRNIIVFNGLIDAVNSEKELAFVLAHELGHFANRDHLRSLGRGLVMVVISVVILGQDNSVSEFIMNSIASAEMKFSQQQELAADQFALKLLNSTYGQVGSALDFLKNMNDKEERGHIRYYFASHPHPEKRISELVRFIEENGLSRKGEK